MDHLRWWERIDLRWWFRRECRAIVNLERLPETEDTWGGWSIRLCRRRRFHPGPCRAR